MKDEDVKYIEGIIKDIENDLPCHDVWNWESELGSWILAMKQAGLDDDSIWKVLKKHRKINELHPADAANIWWEFSKDK